MAIEFFMDKFVQERCTVDQAYQALVNNQNLYRLSKENPNDLHTIQRANPISSSTRDDEELFQYIDIQRDCQDTFEPMRKREPVCPYHVCKKLHKHEKQEKTNKTQEANKLRTIQTYPNPLNLLNDFVFEMNGIKDLEDLNCKALCSYMSHQ